jgi:hypothetical protein
MAHTRLVRPDATLEIERRDGASRAYLIEYDRTRRIDKNYRRFLRYDTFLCWWWRDSLLAHRDDPPFVLFVCPRRPATSGVPPRRPTANSPDTCGIPATPQATTSRDETTSCSPPKSTCTAGSTSPGAFHSFRAATRSDKRTSRHAACGCPAVRRAKRDGARRSARRRGSRRRGRPAASRARRQRARAAPPAHAERPGADRLARLHQAGADARRAACAGLSVGRGRSRSRPERTRTGVR